MLFVNISEFIVVIVLGIVVVIELYQIVAELLKPIITNTVITTFILIIINHIVISII